MKEIEFSTLAALSLIFTDKRSYRAFQITFDEWVPKFVRNFRSSRRTWQFDYEVASQVANFETKLGSSRGRHLRIRLG